MTASLLLTALAAASLLGEEHDREAEKGDSIRSASAMSRQPTVMHPGGGGDKVASWPLQGETVTPYVGINLWLINNQY